MKKILAIVVAAVMISAVCATVSFAKTEPALLISAETLASDANATKSGVSFELKEEGGVKFARFTAENKDPHLYIAADNETDVANHYAVIKYRTTSAAKEIDAYMAAAEPHTIFSPDIVNDGKWQYTYGDLEQSGANWTGKFARLDPLNDGDLTEGDTIDIAWIALFANEADAQAYTGSGSSEPATTEGHYVWNHAVEGNVDDPFNDSTRVGHDSPLTVEVKFKTDVNFSKIFFPKVWAQAHTVATFELITDGKTVYTGTYEFYNEENGSGDVPNVEISFGKKLLAGEYTLKISVEEGQYAFFGYGTDPLSEDYIEFERGHMIFGLYTTDRGQGFVTFATEVTPPPTADAAIIAIAAVACIALAGVVVAKKIK